MPPRIDMPRAVLEGLSKTFQKFRKMRRDKMINLLGEMPCHCCHKARVEQVLRLSAQSRKPSLQRMLIVSLFVLLLCFLLIMLYLTRRYNHAKYHGSGGCVLTFFFSYTNCDVYA